MRAGQRTQTQQPLATAPAPLPFRGLFPTFVSSTLPLNSVSIHLLLHPGSQAPEAQVHNAHHPIPGGSPPGPTPRGVPSHPCTAPPLISLVFMRAPPSTPGSFPEHTPDPGPSPSPFSECLQQLTLYLFSLLICYCLSLSRWKKSSVRSQVSSLWFTAVSPAPRTVDLLPRMGRQAIFTH